MPFAGSDWISHIDDPDQLDFEWASRREAFSRATTESEQRDIVISCFTDRLACLLAATEREGTTCMVDRESKEILQYISALNTCQRLLVGTKSKLSMLRLPDKLSGALEMSVVPFVQEAWQSAHSATIFQNDMTETRGMARSYVTDWEYWRNMGPLDYRGESSGSYQTESSKSDLGDEPGLVSQKTWWSVSDTGLDRDNSSSSRGGLRKKLLRQPSILLEKITSRTSRLKL